MSRPAVQKQKLQQQQPADVVIEPTKVKRSCMLKAVNNWKTIEKFFELDELELAKQWIFGQCIQDKKTYFPSHYYVNRVSTDDSEPYKMYELNHDRIIWMSNERAMKQLQSAIASDESVMGITDMSLQKILEHLNKNKLKLNIEKEKTAEESEESSSDSD